MRISSLTNLASLVLGFFISQVHTASLLSYSGDNAGPTSDADFKEIIVVPSFIFFGQNYSKLFVNEDGVISFNSELSIQKLSPTLPKGFNRTAICLFCADINVSNGGQIFYKLRNDTDTKQSISEDLQHYEEFQAFIPNWVLIVTWVNVSTYVYSSNGNTLQVVVATDGVKSAVIFLYDTIGWIRDGHPDFAPKLRTTVGFNAGDNVNFYIHPSSYTDDLFNLTAVNTTGETGKLIFRVDTDIIAVNKTAAGTTTTELSSAPTSTELSSTPTTTELSSTPTTTELSSAPATTELSSTPTTTEQSLAPATTELSSAPTTTELSSTPTTTELSSTPTTTELSSAPATTASETISSPLPTEPTTVELTSSAGGVPVSTTSGQVSTPLTTIPVDNQESSQGLTTAHYIAIGVSSAVAVAIIVAAVILVVKMASATSASATSSITQSVGSTAPLSQTHASNDFSQPRQLKIPRPHLNRVDAI